MTKTRCSWVDERKPYYVAYHDEEWGVPAHDDRHLFEMLILEGAQAGLSWDTILRKRDAYRAAYDGFDPVRVARYDDAKRQALLSDAGIVRNRAKVAASIDNAQVFLKIVEERGSFAAYLWDKVDGTPVVGRWKTMADVPVSTPLAEAISKDLKKRGMRFVGPTIIYSFLQAVGVVNDHTVDCFRFAELGG